MIPTLCDPFDLRINTWPSDTRLIRITEVFVSLSESSSCDWRTVTARGSISVRDAKKSSTIRNGVVATTKKGGSSSETKRVFKPDVMHLLSQWVVDGKAVVTLSFGVHFLELLHACVPTGIVSKLLKSLNVAEALHNIYCSNYYSYSI